MKFIYVEWLDSGGYPGWCGVDQDFKPMPIKSCGVFIHENAETVALASSFDAEGEKADGMICIPKFAITKRKWVKL